LPTSPPADAAENDIIIVMSSIFFNASLLVVGLICLGVFIYSVHREPRRLNNGIPLVLSIYFSLSGGLHLYAPDILTNDGLALGLGSEILFWLIVLLIFLSLLIGLWLIGNGIKLIHCLGVSLAHLLPLFFGLASIAWPFFYILSTLIFAHKPYFAFFHFMAWNIAIYVPMILLAFLLYSIIYAFLPKGKKFDFIIVLGASLNNKQVTPILAKRLQRAIQLFNQSDQKATFIVAGGKGDDEIIPEAQAMRNYLLAQGIPKNKICQENQSRNTLENLKFSQQIIKQKHSPAHCAIVTSNYHVLRAVDLARSLKMTADGFASSTQFYYLPAAFIREYLAIIFEYHYLALAYTCFTFIWSATTTIFISP
jgi:uncharacterized SAM-binding protein YcdF (DUF218 family)